MKNLMSRRKAIQLSTLATTILFTPGIGAAISWKGYPRLMQGPMAGWVGSDKINIWTRASGAYSVQIEYSVNADMSQAMRTPGRVADKARDYTTVFTLSNLKPDTRYFYRVLLDGRLDTNHKLLKLAPFPIRTAPIPGKRKSFKVAFGSCIRTQQNPVQPVWHAIADQHPDLFLWTGDNIYADATDPDIIAEEYRRQRNIPEMQGVMRTVPQLATWDDHDYGLNDQDTRNPIKQASLEVFKRYWANPAYGLEEVPGVFFTSSYGDVDFFFLDVRYHRTPIPETDGPAKTMLGAPQKLWLKESLKRSKASFKIIISGSAWTDAKGAGSDSWSSYRHERSELFDFIREQKIGGILLISGDTHIGELNSIPQSDLGGYDLYELVSSPLAQKPSVSWLNYHPTPRIRQIYAGGSNFGLLEFNMDSRDPELTFTLHDTDGNSIWEPFRIRVSELRNGVTSYEQKMDKASRYRYQRTLDGKPYYGPAE